MDLLAGYSDNSESEFDDSPTNIYSDGPSQVNNQEIMAWERAPVTNTEKSKESENKIRVGSNFGLLGSSKVGGGKEEWHKADANNQSSLISSNKANIVQPDSRTAEHNNSGTALKSPEQHPALIEGKKMLSCDQSAVPRCKDRKSRSSEKQKRSRSRERRRRSPGKKKRSRSRERRCSRSPDKRRRSRSRSDDRSWSSRRWDRHGGRVKRGTGRSGSQELRRHMEEQANKAKELSGVALPKYYSLGGVNPLKYAEQEKKKKLLWGSKDKKDVPAPSYNRWEHTSFDKDSDGKMAAKFKKLMGIKENANANTGGKDLLRKQSELFSTLDQQYEVARLSTHTQRGVGLGFSTTLIPKP